MTMSWYPTSWSLFSSKQLPIYPDQTALNKVLNDLSSREIFLQPDPIIHLREQLSRAQSGNAFIFQAGDCAERFIDTDGEVIDAKILHLNKLSELLSKQLNIPIVKVGRIAGQFSKPRTNFNDQALYRGDLINDIDATDRTPDPARLILAYEAAKKVNAMLPDTIYTSHEALHLAYESALTRQFDHKWFNLSTHFPWLGMRTTESLAHVEYLRGIENPLGIKIGPTMHPDNLCDLVRILNPKNQTGKIMLIHRLGMASIVEKLPLLIKKLQQERLSVLWSVDPMHGNTEFTSTGIKTRRMENVIEEFNLARDIHDRQGSLLSGLHLEITHEAVTECMGLGVCESDLATNYQSLVDPRLNYNQSLEVCGLVK